MDTVGAKKKKKNQIKPKRITLSTDVVLTKIIDLVNCIAAVPSIRACATVRRRIMHNAIIVVNDTRVVRRTMMIIATIMYSDRSGGSERRVRTLNRKCAGHVGGPAIYIGPRRPEPTRIVSAKPSRLNEPDHVRSDGPARRRRGCKAANTGPVRHA